jgi:amino acid transporter
VASRTEIAPSPAAPAPDDAPRPKRVLTVFTLVMITTGIITSIHGAPSMAEFGFGSLFIYLSVAVVFLIPTALISAELATGWPADGGVYVWVREAFGERWGFLAVWQQWAENAIWFPSILQVTVITAAFAFNPSLQNNKTYVFIGVNLVFWSLTLLNLLGMRTSAIIATVGTIGGRIVPIVFIVGLAIAYLVRGDSSQIAFTAESFVPDVENFGHIAFIVGAFLTFAGIEASASNAASARNPRRDYPIAIMISAGLALVLVTVVALAIAVVLPQGEISLTAGLMEALEKMLDVLSLGGLLPIIAAVIAVGMLGEINNWLAGPTRGMLVAARDGSLPPFFQKQNHRAVHSRILLTQAVFVSAFSTLTLFFNVQSAFWIMNVLPTQLYLIMYFLMFAAAVRLRYTRPDVPRRYRVPVGNLGIWMLACVGTVAGLVAIAIGFVPPSTVPSSQVPGFVAVIAVGFVAITAVPLVVYHLRPTRWRPRADALSSGHPARERAEA